MLAECSSIDIEKSTLRNDKMTAAMTMQAIEIIITSFFETLSKCVV